MTRQGNRITAEATVSPELETRSDDFFMALALEEARLARGEREVPIGCVIELGGQVVSGAHNRPIALKDPTAHAEILALREACRRLGNYRLNGASLYVTIEPCPMCVGGILQARIRRLVYGAADEKAGAVDSLFHLASDPRLNHQVEVIRGVREESCRALMKSFFAGKRSESARD
jgi:tRNA(adenine34) deaminase